MRVLTCLVPSAGRTWRPILSALVAAIITVIPSKQEAQGVHFEISYLNQFTPKRVAVGMDGFIANGARFGLHLNDRLLVDASVAVGEAASDVGGCEVCSRRIGSVHYAARIQGRLPVTRALDVTGAAGYAYEDFRKLRRGRRDAGGPLIAAGVHLVTPSPFSFGIETTAHRTPARSSLNGSTSWTIGLRALAILHVGIFGHSSDQMDGGAK
jgi:hypothetical protein